MSYYLYVINKHRHVLSSDLTKLLIDSLVFSHLNYSLPVWGPSLHQNHLQRLKRMQNRGVRLCRNLKKFDHITEHYRALRWLPLEYLIQYRCLCLMNRQYHGYRCIDLCPPLQFGRFHQYGTRVRYILRDTDYPILKNIFVTSLLIGGIPYLNMSLPHIQWGPFHIVCIITSVMGYINLFVLYCNNFLVCSCCMYVVSYTCCIVCDCCM